MITGRKFCPQCGSEEVVMAAGGITGGWICKNCGFLGPFPERPFLGREMKGEKEDKVLKDIKEAMKEIKGKGKKK